MTQIQFQNPATPDVILDSVQVAAGSPPTNREIVVIGDSTGANVVLVSGRIPVDSSGVTQPVSLSGNVTIIQPIAANLNATVVFAAPQHIIVDSGSVAADVTDRTSRLLGNVRTQDGSGNALTSTGAALDVNIKTSSIALPVSLASAVDVSDRAARLLGVIYGSQGQQIKQTATNFNSQVELATGGTLYDARQIRALTSSDVVTVAQATAANLNATIVFSSPQHVIADSGSISITGTPTVDVTDRAARLLGVVYGSQAQQLKQTATNFNLQVELATSGTLYDARQIRALTAADVVTANQGGAPWTVKPDGTVWALTGTSANVNVTNTPAVTLASTTITGTVAVTQSTSPWVANISQFGGNPVVTGIGVSGAGIPRVTVSSDSFPATQAVSVVSLPLPTNAVQETGGNLATLVTQTRNDAQVVDLLTMVIARLDAINMTMAHQQGNYINPDDLLVSVNTIQ